MPPNRPSMTSWMMYSLTILKLVHSRKVIWNPNIGDHLWFVDVSPFPKVIFRFHVSFRACITTCSYSRICRLASKSSSSPWPSHGGSVPQALEILEHRGGCRYHHF